MRTALVCGVQAPFITGGAEILVSELKEALARRGNPRREASAPLNGDRLAPEAMVAAEPHQ